MFCKIHTFFIYFVLDARVLALSFHSYKAVLDEAPYDIV